jgi:hypothetical protein
MNKEQKEAKINELLKEQDVFVLKNIEHVNHNPHPFMIGHRHVAYASDNCSGILDKRALNHYGCAQVVKGRTCGLSYEEHTSDEVGFLQLKRNATNNEVSGILKKLVDELGEKFIDGFAFVDTKEKFRIE